MPWAIITLALRQSFKKSKTEAEAIGLKALARVGLNEKARAFPNELSAASSKEWPLPARWPWSRRSCSSTSRPAPLDPELGGKRAQRDAADARSRRMTMVVVSMKCASPGARRPSASHG